jgi:hypothetical protein
LPDFGDRICPVIRIAVTPAAYAVNAEILKVRSSTQPP